MKALTSTHRAVLIAILIASLALSILFALHVPLGGDPQHPGNPDEGDHRDYIRLIVQNHGLVKFTPAPFDMISTDEHPRPFETHQSPLYYLLCIPVHLASGGSVFAVRMVSAILQLLTILVAFRAMRDLFPERTDWALYAGAFVAFLPSQAQLAGAISNDSLTTLICATIFWKLSRLLRKGQNTRDIAMLGGLIGLGILTKISVFQLLPTVAVAYVVGLRLGRFPTAGAAAIAFAKTLLLGLLIASPWLIRNTLLYGDPLALHIYKLTGPNLTPDQTMPLFGWTMSDYLRNVGIRSFASFWYLVNPYLPARLFVGPLVPLVVVVVLAFGSLLGIYRAAKEGQGTPEQRTFVGFSVAAILLLVPFFTEFVLTVFQAQGRYFLPVLLPVAVVSVVGWAQVAGTRRSSFGAFFLLFVLFVLCLVQLWTY
jgi:4-amino-4-deoxy-L-arabinose transferase-like glycosyltransferase